MFSRHEMMLVREKQKEEEVAALKRSMQSGMVKYSALNSVWSVFSSNIMFFFARWKLSKVSSLLISGSSNERASSTERRNGVSVQAWKFWGEGPSIFHPLAADDHHRCHDFIIIISITITVIIAIPIVVIVIIVNDVVLIVVLFCSYLDLYCCFICRLLLLFREDWIQMLQCELCCRSDGYFWSCSRSK